MVNPSEKGKRFELLNEYVAEEVEPGLFAITLRDGKDIDDELNLDLLNDLIENAPNEVVRGVLQDVLDKSQSKKD